MSISAEVRATIRRMHFNDHLSVNFIASKMGCHHKTVENCIKKDPNFKTEKPRKGLPAFLKEHEETMKSILDRYPNITAPRLAEILKEKSVSCSKSSAGRALIDLRGKRKGRVFSIRSYIPGQEAQVDWGEIKVDIGGQKQKIYIFVIVLSYSRNLFAYATTNMKFETFTGCHSKAFDYFHGVPRRILYDNLKSVVIERAGDNIRFSKNFFDYAAHYLFEPVACHVRCPQEKGMVERNVSTVKNGFFCAREFSSIEDVNLQLFKWLEQRKLQKHPTDRKETILESSYKEDLLDLPKKTFYPRRYETVKVGKQPYVQFEANRYSIPYQHAFNQLSLHIGMHDIEIYRESELIAIHARSFDKDKIIDDLEHLKSLSKLRKKTTAATYSRTYFLRLIPQTENLFRDLAKRGEPLQGVLKRIENLIDRYGIKKVETAFIQAEKDKEVQIDAIEMILERDADSNQGTRDLIRLNLPKNLQSVKTKHHDLKNYDINGGA